MSIKRPPALISVSDIKGIDLAAHAHYLRVTDGKGRSTV